MNTIEKLVEETKKGDKTTLKELSTSFYSVYHEVVSKFTLFHALESQEEYLRFLEEVLDDKKRKTSYQEALENTITKAYKDKYLSQFKKHESAVIIDYFKQSLKEDSTLEDFLIKMQAVESFITITNYQLPINTILDVFKDCPFLDFIFQQGLTPKDNVVSKKDKALFKSELASYFLEGYCICHDLSIEEETKEENESFYCDDSIKMYLQEIRDIPLLTREEEYDLGKRIKDGDQDALNTLVTRNLKWVVNIAKYYDNKNIPFLDIIQEGNIGLITALENFDVTRGFRFTTYATFFIKQSITRAISSKNDMIRKPYRFSSQKKAFYDYKEKIERSEGKTPSIEEIRQELGLSNKAIERMLEYMSLDTVFSLNNKTDDGDEFIKLIADTNSDVNQTLLDSSLSKDVNAFFASCDLSEMEKAIIINRFGLFDKDIMTLEKISEIYGVSREQIRQRELKALQKMRKTSSVKSLAVYMDNPDQSLINLRTGTKELFKAARRAPTIKSTHEQGKEKGCPDSLAKELIKRSNEGKKDK